jgi:hypothetical protein
MPISNDKARLIAGELGLNPAKASAAPTGETIAPATWIVTVERADGTCLMATTTITDPLHPDELAGWFGDLCADHDGRCGHATNAIDESVLYFGLDTEAMRDYVAEHQAFKGGIQAKRGFGK